MAACLPSSLRWWESLIAATSASKACLTPNAADASTPSPPASLPLYMLVLSVMCALLSLVLDQLAQDEPVPGNQRLGAGEAQNRAHRVEVQQGPARLLAGAAAVHVSHPQGPLKPRTRQ